MYPESANNESHTDKKKKAVRNSFREYGQYLSLGFQLAAAVVIFFFLGDWIDKRCGIAPTGKLVGTLIGMVGGFIKFFKSVASLIADEERNRMRDKHED